MPEFDLSREADRIVLESYGPVAVIVGADLNVRQFRGSLAPYLELAPGKASLHLLRMAKEGLADALSEALRTANESAAPVHRQDVRIPRDGKVVAVGFSVIPIRSPTGECFYLVLFRDVPGDGGERPLVGHAVLPHAAEATAGTVGELERELSGAREYARAILEDKEAANEELRSANEELQSANEELRSANEELATTSEEVQSTNEELQTLNDELHAANEALDQREFESQVARDFARAVVDAVREPLLVLDALLRVVSANRSYYARFRTTPGDVEGQPFFEIGGGTWNNPALREAVSGVVGENRDFQDLVLEWDSPQHPGLRTMLVSGRHIVTGTAGPQRNVLLAIEDITERRSAETLSEALDAVNLAMISSLDYQEILEGTLAKAAEALGCDEADLAATEAGSWLVGYSLRRPSGRHEDGGRATIARASSAGATGAVAAPGFTVQVPLRVHGEVVGALSFGRDASKTAFTAIELDFVNKLAPALALALENAHLYSTERRVAHVLQASLLGPLSAPPPFEVGVAYRPAHEAERVGGDFYDLFAMENGHVAIVVGDVSGKGVEAASLTGTVRAALRAFASVSSSPAFLLAKANELLLAQVPPEIFVTALVIIVDPTSGRLTLSSAGHPRAAVCGSSTRFLDVVPGTPLGAMSSTYHEAAFDLVAGDTVVLFTDGLVEARQGGALFGEEGVSAALAGQDCGDAQGLVDTLVARATEFAGGRLQDDLAVIAVRMPA